MNLYKKMYYKEMRIIIGAILAYLAINLIGCGGMFLSNNVFFPNHHFFYGDLMRMNLFLELLLVIGLFAMLIKNSLGIKRELIIKIKGKKYFFKLLMIQLAAAILMSVIINIIAMLFISLYSALDSNAVINFVSLRYYLREYIQFISVYVCLFILVIYLKDKQLNTMKKYTSHAACIKQTIITVIRFFIIGALLIVLAIALSQVTANYGSLYFLYSRFTDEQLILLAPAVTISFVIDYYRFYTNEVIL